MVFTLHNTDPDYPLAYQPGQYAAISFMRHGRPTPARCFSMASSPTEQDILQFAIRVKGHYTRSAARYIQPGDKISIGGPFGGFIFNTERDKTSVFLAGGIGIAPFMSMIRYATRLGLTNEIMLLYGCQSQEDVPFAEELLYLEQVNPHFHVVFAISRGPLTRFAGRRAVAGHVTPELLHQIIAGAYATHSFFICGPPRFMSTMLDTLKTNGTPADHILTEAFSQAAQKRGAWISRPAHVYALTAAGLLLGSATVMAQDVVKNKSTTKINKKNASSANGEDGSRQSDINDVLSGLPDDLDDFTSTTVDGDAETTDVGMGDILIDEGTGLTPEGTPTTKPSTSTGSTGGTSGGGSSTGGSSTVTKTKPTVTFSASASSVVAGGSTTLSWSTGGTAPITCTASGGWSGGKATSGSQSVRPSATTTYTLSCSNSAGTTARSVTVTVNPVSSGS